MCLRLVIITVYLQHVLCPELQPGEVVILDNLATHKIAAVEKLITARAASVRYLPAYSPDLNPIGVTSEKVLSCAVEKRFKLSK